MTKDLLTLFQIDKSIPVPLYFQFKQQLKDLIENGSLPVGAQIPTENDLTLQLQISRPTIRQALKELINEGYLVRKKPIGTFVAERKTDSFFFTELTSYQDEMKQLGLIPSTKVLEIKVEDADEQTKEHLRLTDDDQVLFIRRLRFANDTPRVIVDTYLPYHLVKGIEKLDLERSSLYELLASKYDLPVESVEREIQAVMAKKKQSKLLLLSGNNALCKTTTVAYSVNDLPIEYSIAYYRGDNNRFKLKLSKK